MGAPSSEDGNCCDKTRDKPRPILFRHDATRYLTSFPAWQSHVQRTTVDCVKFLYALSEARLRQPPLWLREEKVEIVALTAQGMRQVLAKRAAEAGLRRTLAEPHYYGLRQPVRARVAQEPRDDPRLSSPSQALSCAARGKLGFQARDLRRTTRSSTDCALIARSKLCYLPKHSAGERVFWWETTAWMVF